MASARESSYSKFSLHETDLFSLPIRGLVTGVGLQEGEGGLHFF